MRRTTTYLALLATSELVGAHQPFSVHDDLVAYPQYEIVFSESFISEHDARALLQRADPHATYAADFSRSDLSHVREAATDHEEDNGLHSGSSPGERPETYEVMHLAPAKYLCSIPILEQPAQENHTASELAKKEEARELARASTAGWDLLNELEGTCLYFMSGWWSYSFCYNRQIVQFHALPMIPNGKPPVRDPTTMEFVLGRAAKSSSAQDEHQQQKGQQDKQQRDGQQRHHHHQASSATTDVQIKGDQRYLVQRLDDGTICDLTGRARTIEVQYHCVPGMKGDRIGWIKEVTTCAYVMVVNTPRLCEDVAFQPPRQTTANPISCRLILDTDDPSAEAEWHRRKTIEAEGAMTEEERSGVQQPVQEGQTPEQREEGGDPLFAENGRPDLDSASSNGEGVGEVGQGGGQHIEGGKGEKLTVVGGVVVGGRNVLGGEADKDGRAAAVLRAPTSYLPNKAHARQPVGEAGAPPEEHVTTIAARKAAADGGTYWALTEEELAELELEAKLMDQMKEEMERQAGDKGWKLEIAETPGGARELRGYVDDGDEGDDFFYENEYYGEGEGDGKGEGDGHAGSHGDGDEDNGQEADQGSQERFYGNDW